MRMRKTTELVEKVLNGSGLGCFFIRFLLSSLLLIVLFNFTFPLYRSFLIDSIQLLTRASQEEMSKVSLVIMPYVSISAIAVSTTKKPVKQRLVFVAVLFAFFYIIDMSFAVLHLSLQDTVLTKSQILLAQDLLNVAFPVIAWVYIYFDEMPIRPRPKSEKDI